MEKTKKEIKRWAAVLTLYTTCCIRVTTPLLAIHFNVQPVLVQNRSKC